jgi:hypothetical protein
MSIPSGVGTSQPPGGGEGPIDTEIVPLELRGNSPLGSIDPRGRRPSGPRSQPPPPIPPGGGRSMGDRRGLAAPSSGNRVPPREPPPPPRGGPSAEPGPRPSGAGERRGERPIDTEIVPLELRGNSPAGPVVPEGRRPSAPPPREPTAPRSQPPLPPRGGPSGGRSPDPLRHGGAPAPGPNDEVRSEPPPCPPERREPSDLAPGGNAGPGASGPGRAGEGGRVDLRSASAQPFRIGAPPTNGIHGPILAGSPGAPPGIRRPPRPVTTLWSRPVGSLGEPPRLSVPRAGGGGVPAEPPPGPLPPLGDTPWDGDSRDSGPLLCAPEAATFAPAPPRTAAEPPPGAGAPSSSRPQSSPPTGAEPPRSAGRSGEVPPQNPPRGPTIDIFEGGNPGDRGFVPSPPLRPSPAMVDSGFVPRPPPPRTAAEPPPAAGAPSSSRPQSSPPTGAEPPRSAGPGGEVPPQTPPRGPTIDLDPAFGWARSDPSLIELEPPGPLPLPRGEGLVSETEIFHLRDGPDRRPEAPPPREEPPRATFERESQ